MFIKINNHPFCNFILFLRLRIIIIGDGFSFYCIIADEFSLFSAAGFKFLYVEKSARSLLY